MPYARAPGHAVEREIDASDGLGDWIKAFSAHAVRYSNEVGLAV
jgi:hypothetical protein